MRPVPVLITGGGGFIGQHASHWLADRGHPVTVLSRRAPSDPRLQDRIAQGEIALRLCELNDPAGLAAALEGLGPHWLLHLASKVEASRRFDGLEQHFAAHLGPIFQLMESLEGRVLGACLMSSIDAYGVPASLPVTESTPSRPFNLYGTGKLNAERLFQAWAEAADFPLCVLRPSQVYGPGDLHLKAIPVFIERCLRGEPISLQGDGTETRDYVSVRDVCNAIGLAIEGRAQGLFNVSSGRSVNMLQLLELIQALCGKKAELVPVPAARPKVDYRFDLTKASAVLGYAPTVPLAEGLAETIAWAKGRLP